MFGQSSISKRCFLCGEPHAQKDCPGLTAAKQAAKTAKKVTPSKVDKHQKASRRSPRRASSPEKEDLEATAKKLTLEMAELKKTVGEQREKNVKYKKAYAAVQDPPHSSHFQSSLDHRTMRRSNLPELLPKLGVSFCPPSRYLTQEPQTT